MTPYELNLDMWRQLWRVIERSDLVVQIVDARNPLLFMCSDLDMFVKEEEVSRGGTQIPLLLLLNKADLLTEAQRSIWLSYFNSVGILCIFYSANMQNPLINQSEIEKPVDTNVTEESSSFKKDSLNFQQTIMDPLEEKIGYIGNDISQESSKTSYILSMMTNSTRIISPKELLGLFEKLRGDTTELFNVGLVGYPNVGKSSTINSILNAKKVRVGATPGKTKHLQTIFVDEVDQNSKEPLEGGSSLCLVDCPGLIFPNFAATRAELVVNGILPIDQLRDFTTPCDLVAFRIPRQILQSCYGSLPLPGEGECNTRPPTGRELICSFINSRGMSDSEYSKVARIILKDYVSGTRLLYVHPPPGQPEFNVIEENRPFEFKSTFASKEVKSISTEYLKESVAAYTKGKFASDSYTRGIGSSSSSEGGVHLLPMSKRNHFKGKKINLN